MNLIPRPPVQPFIYCKQGPGNEDNYKQWGVTGYCIGRSFRGRKCLQIGGKKFIVDCSLVPPNFAEKTFTNSHKTLKFSKVSHYTVGRLSFWNSDQKVALFLGLYAFISLFWVQNSHNAGVEIKLRTVVLLPYSLTVELLMNNTPLIPGGNLLISKTNLLGELTLLEGYLSHLRSLPSSQPPPSSAFPAAVLCTAAPHQRPWTRKPAVAENWFELLAFYHWATSILVLHRWC